MVAEQRVVDRSKLREAALRYAEIGWSVVPCRPGSKVPIAAPWFPSTRTYVRSSSDPERVSQWWDEHPRANVGVACGPSKLLVIDVDGREGQALLDDLQRKHGPLSETLTARAYRGAHYYFNFSRPTGDLVGWLGPRLEVVAAGCHVMAPPSLHPSGRRYEWTNWPTEPAEPPPWLDRFLRLQPMPGPRYEPRPQPSKPLTHKRLFALFADLVVTASVEPARLHSTVYESAREAAERGAPAAVVDFLYDSSVRAGLDPEEAARTIDRGLKAGGGA